MRVRRYWPMAAAGGLVSGLVWANVQATLVGYRVASAREEIEKLKGANAYLQLELDRLHAPSRLELEAKRRLGMRPPDPDRMQVLTQAPPGQRPRGERGGGPSWLASAFRRQP